MDLSAVLPAQVGLSQRKMHRAHEFLDSVSNPSSKDEGALNTLEFDLPVADAERLLKTEYFVYEHDESGYAHFACDEYYVAAHISEHINIITSTLRWDIIPYHYISRRNVLNLADPVMGSHPNREKSHGTRKPTAHTGNTNSLQNCLNEKTPAYLRALYNIPEPTDTPSKGNSFGVVEYNSSTHIPLDLD
ncbi:hypothetical protein K469DRAFT_685703 [Zopfia rhizophila CBS 207.26]|uniref:Peptidase S53 activation domain-containing protein n=1 Tax=Zopfia rhizophila CBS 207.26 TaxID=1314779 RepID=A0A6A6E9M1_9PEZI|nr:hypothetical protein K469DRAFT_685703 [Zopfia rhizophila CBS 207.26]